VPVESASNLTSLLQQRLSAFTFFFFSITSLAAYHYHDLTTLTTDRSTCIRYSSPVLLNGNRIRRRRFISRCDIDGSYHNATSQKIKQFKEYIQKNQRKLLSIRRPPLLNARFFHSIIDQILRTAKLQILQLINIIKY